MSVSGKPSGLKPPSKIARPTSISISEQSLPSNTNQDGGHSTVKKLDNEITKSKITDDEYFENWQRDRKLSEHDGVRRSSDPLIVLTEDTDSFIVGERVWVGGTKPGRIAFIGETQFGPGDWAGIVLDEPIGKNDGTVAGIRYFQCGPNRGVFSRLTRLTRSYIDPSQITTPKSNGTPTLSTPDSSILGASTYSTCKTPATGSTTTVPKNLILDDRVIVKSSQGSKAGILRYFGTTEFGPGVWCGVELDDPLGKNDGTVNGIRYFECAPKFGLFVPADKVCRSPISVKKGPNCVIHPGSLSRQGSQDSFRSISSIATTTASSIKSNARVRLGVNSLNHQQPRSSSITPARSTQALASRSPLQAVLKEKDAQIQQLIKEKEMERREMIRAATQADETEKKMLVLKEHYNKICAENELQQTSLICAVDKLEKRNTELSNQLDEYTKKIEDLQFTCEEESLSKSEMQALNEEYREKLEKIVSLDTGECPTTTEKDIDDLTDESTISNHSASVKDSLINQLSNLCKEIHSNVNPNFKPLENLLSELKLLLSENENLKELIENNEKFRILHDQLHHNSILFPESLKIVITLKKFCQKIQDTNSKILDAIFGKIAINNIENDLIEIKNDFLDFQSLELKDIFFEFLRNIENLINNNVRCLERIETLTEVINKKDEEILQISKEKNELRKELSEYEKNQQTDLQMLQKQHHELKKVKQDLEIQLKMSDENIKKMQQLFHSKDESSKLEIENMKSILNEKILEYEELSKEFSEKIGHLTDEIVKKDIQTADNLEQQQKIIEKLNTNIEETVNRLDVIKNEKQEVENNFTHFKATKEVEISNLKQICGELTEKTKNLEVLLNEKITEISGTDEKIAEIENLKLQMTTKSQEYEKSSKTFEDKLRKLNEEIAIRTKAYDVIKNKFHIVLQQTDKKSSDDLEISELSEMKDKCSNLNPEMEIIIREMTDSWMPVISKLITEISNFKLVIENSQNEVSKKETIISDYDFQLKKLADEMSVMCNRSTIEDVQSKHLALEHTYEESRKINDLLESRIKEFTEKYDNLANENEQLKSQLDNYYSKYEQTTRRLFELDNEKSETYFAKEELLNKQYLNLQQEKLSLEEKLMSNEKVLSYLKEEVSRRDNEINDINVQLNEREEKFSSGVAGLNERLMILEEQAQVSSREKSQKDNENQILRQQLENRNKILDEKDKNHENELKRMNEKLKNMILQNEKYSERISALSNELKIAVDNLNDVKKLSEAECQECKQNKLKLSNNHEPNSEEKNELEQQIKFLNSVIVDMQRKNEKLLEKNKYVGISEITHPKPRLITPRMFCDICDMFDLHETEDCPKQDNSSRPTPTTRVKTKLPERPYCDNCEIFGHDTAQCNEEVTF